MHVSGSLVTALAALLTRSGLALVCRFVEVEELSRSETWASLAADACGAGGVDLVLVGVDVLDTVCFSEAQADAWLAAAAALLSRGGAIAGVCIDSAQAWVRAQKASLDSGELTAGVVTDDLFDIAYEDGFDTFRTFGTGVVFTLRSGGDEMAADDKRRALVHFASLMRLARPHALHLVDATNLLEFFDDNKRPHASLLKRCGVLPPKASTLEQSGLIRMFSTFVFVKER